MDTARDTAEQDRIDRKLDVWAREIPGLDVATEAIVQRIWHVNRFLRRTMDETLERFGLNAGEYHLLTTLRGAGPPYRLSPGRLAESLGLSSGAITNRLDRLEEAGLVRRLRDPGDRRALLVEPTEQGHALWDQAVAEQATKEALVASTLDDDEKAQLGALLRRLMLALEREAADPR